MGIHDGPWSWPGGQQKCGYPHCGRQWLEQMRSHMPVARLHPPVRRGPWGSSAQMPEKPGLAAPARL